MCLRHWILGLCLFQLTSGKWGHAAEFVAAREPAVQSVIDSLRAAHQQFLSESSFHCTFTLAIWNATLGEEESRKDSGTARGALSKRGQLKRLALYKEQQDPDAAAKPPDAAPSFIRGLSVDSLIGKAAYLSFYPPRSDGFDMVEVARFADNASLVNAGGCIGVERELSVVNPLPGCRRDLFCGERTEATDVDYSTKELDSDRVVVTTTKRKSIGTSIGVLTCTTTFWVKPATPAVESIVIRQVKVANGIEELLSLEKVSLEDFKTCGEFAVAATVRRELQFPNKTVNISEWQSDDLGLRSPVDDDFVVQILPSTRIVGARPGTIAAGKLTLGPECLADDAILKPGTEEAIVTRPAQSAPPPASRGMAQRMAIGLSFIAILIIAMLLLRRTR